MKEPWQSHLTESEGGREQEAVEMESSDSWLRNDPTPDFLLSLPLLSGEKRQRIQEFCSFENEPGSKQG